MIYAVKQFENYKYRVNMVLKRLKNDNVNDYSRDLQLYDVLGLVIINFNSSSTKGPEVIDL